MRSKAATALTPFTLEHVSRWALDFRLDTGEPWVLEDFQLAFLEDVFAGYQECWLVIPEGNAKTTLAAGLGLYHLEYTHEAEVPIAASSREQAEIMYRAAEGLVRRSPKARARFRCLPGWRRIWFDEAGQHSRMQVFAADDRTGDGVIPSLSLLDELHRHRDLRLYRTWQGKLEKRNGQQVAISTSGEPGSEFETLREAIRQGAEEIERTETYVRAVSAGLVLHEYAVPEDGDTDDLELVKRANPLRAITVERLERKKASPTFNHAHWRRFVCNLPTRSERAAITEAEWHGARVNEEIPEGVPVWAGLDVAWKWDTTALVPLWIRDQDYRLLGPASILVPPRNGVSLDPNEVEAALVRMHQRNPIHTVVMDPTKAEQLAEWIRNELGAEVLERGQTNTYAATDYERFMEALREGWLKHTGDRGLTSHVLNAIARLLPGGGARFDRPHASRLGSEQDMRVIDALSAAAMVHTVAAAEFGVEEREPMIAWV